MFVGLFCALYIPATHGALVSRYADSWFPFTYSALTEGSSTNGEIENNWGLRKIIDLLSVYFN